MEKPAENQYPIHELLRKRWSPRVYAPRFVEEEKIFSLFEAARWSPSGGNIQPWFFVVSVKSSLSEEENEDHARFLEVLNEGNRAWARSAPVLIMAIAKRERGEGRPNAWALYDLGQAVGHLTVQASALGLSMRQMGGYDPQKARETFDIPEGYDPITAIALGYPGDVDDLPEELRQREMQARTRRPVSEFVFAGHWGEPLRETTTIAE